MFNFLFCYDSNYNIPASCSIISLLNHVSEKVNIYIMHQDESNSKFLPINITSHNMVNSLKVYKVNLNNYKFPNIQGSHVSEATYYRLFIQDYLEDDIEFITYLDCDAFCINNPLPLIENEINNLKKSELVISSIREVSLTEHGKQLNIKSGKYFNAGIMVINFETWNKNNLKDHFLKILNIFNTKLRFWDQDILNIYFDGKYQLMDENLNFRIDMGIDNREEIIDEEQQKNIIFVHYSGKFKPWTVRGAVNNNSKYFQEIFRDLFKRKYFILFNYKKNAVNDLVRSIMNRSLFRTDYPLHLIKDAIFAIVKK